jgi:hypothetical protein
MSAHVYQTEYPDLVTGWAGTAVEASPAARISVDAPPDRLLAALERHIAAEDEVLMSYRALVESTTDPLVALLLQQVGSDEERHHRLLRSLAARLRDTLEVARAPAARPGSGTPAVVAVWRVDA